VSESKTLVNGIDTCVDQTVTLDQNKVESTSFTEHSSSLCLPAVPDNSPVADSTDGGSSWFTSLTTVVDSPSSYPKWRDSETAAAISPLNSAISRGSHSSQLSSSSSVFSPDVDGDDLEPPAKRQLLQQTAADDGVSTTAASAPLLGQLLSSSTENGEVESHEDDDDADDDVEDCSVDSSNTDTSSTDLTCMSSGDSISDVQHEGLSCYNISSLMYSDAKL